MDYDFDIVVLTSGNKGTPHLETLLKHNPGIVYQIKICPEIYGRHFNCDLNIRGHRSHSNRTLFLEYDVLVNCDLREVFMEAYDAECSKYIPSIVEDNKDYLFSEVNKLPSRMKPSACLMAPSAVLMLSRKVLKVIARPIFDVVFDKDILSEVRLASVIEYSGFKCRANPKLSNVRCYPRKFDTAIPGVYHPVKQ